MHLIERVEQVRDQSSFIAFVRALQADRANPVTRDEWQNDTIEDYLEAAVAWAEAAPMQPHSTSDISAIWRACAQFLYCGKIYE